MRLGQTYVVFGAVLAVGLLGCRSKPNHLNVGSVIQPIANTTSAVEPASFADEDNQPPSDVAPGEELPLPADDDAERASPEQLAVLMRSSLVLDEVVSSIQNHFPLIRQATAARGIASGEALSASGAFDHKLDGFTESQPLDFYENSRHSLGVKRDTMWGGQVFAGYRIGRGSFEPWYLERETNKGGEFKAGVVVPLVRDRWIDTNRAELWQARLEQRRVEPEIMAQVILFVRDGTVAYWNWVAAGENYRIAQDLLKLAVERNEALEKQVRAQEKASIDLVDNRRIIVSRKSKLIDARRKLEQAAVKLSLFYRSDVGEPSVVGSGRLPENFIQLAPQDETSVLPEESEDTSLALDQRPKLAELQLLREQLSVALRQAQNETWPDVDGGLRVSQDMGEPTSPKRDKSQFQLQASIAVSVPLERRKALGKVRSLRWKLAQLTAKNRFAADKIVAEVRLARAAIPAAIERVRIAGEGYDLAVRMQQAEQDLFEQGQSTLLNLNIRERQAAEAAIVQVEALFEFFVAKADYAAALGYDTPTR